MTLVLLLILANYCDEEDATSFHTCCSIDHLPTEATINLHQTINKQVTATTEQNE
jgi:L-amino acid N-acyltransferase YncA